MAGDMKDEQESMKLPSTEEIFEIFDEYSNEDGTWDSDGAVRAVYVEGRLDAMTIFRNFLLKEEIRIRTTKTGHGNVEWGMVADIYRTFSGHFDAVIAQMTYNEAERKAKS